MDMTKMALSESACGIPVVEREAVKLLKEDRRESLKDAQWYLARARELMEGVVTNEPQDRWEPVRFKEYFEYLTKYCCKRRLSPPRKQNRSGR